MIFGASRPRRPRNTTRTSRRTPDETARSEELPPKLIPSLRVLVSTATSLAHTRLALAGLELEEEIQRLIGAAVLAIVAMVLALLALVVGTFTIVAAVPPEYRVGTMIAITLVYLVIALVIVLRLKGIFASRPPIFGATLAELEKDKETLRQMARAHDAAEEAAERERVRHRDESVGAQARAGRRDTMSAGAL